MKFPCFGIKVSKLVVLYVLNILEYVKFMVYVTIYCLCLLNLRRKFRTQEHETNSDIVSSPPESISSIPAYVSTVLLEPLKKRIPIVEFGDFLERRRSSNIMGKVSELVICSICLKSLERSHEIRELSNCSHVFHRECLDMWIDQYHLTCPLCRAKLVSCQGEDQIGFGVEGDPWRVERMQYLYGEDRRPRWTAPMDC